MLEPMKWSTVTPLPPNYFFEVATKKDLLVYYDSSNDQSPVMAIRRRNAKGVYESVGILAGYQTATPSAVTNGKWISFLGDEGMVLFNIDNKNTVSEPSFLMSYGTYILSDDTVVGCDPASPLDDGSNSTFRSYQYESSNNTWLNIPGTEVITTTPVYSIGNSLTYLATDTHLLFADFTNSSSIHIQIYARQADKSWKFVESVPINSTFGLALDLNYNGIDTLVVSYGTAALNDSSTGVVFVYTKANGQWSEQTFTTASVGYRPQGYLGQATAFVDANSLLVSAGAEGYNIEDEAPNGGKVLLMTRNGKGLWEPSLDLISPTGTGLWGTSVGINDYDIIVPTLVQALDGSSNYNLPFSTLPACFIQPINVTCHDKQVNDCSQLSQVDTSSLFTVNNAQCGAVSATLNGLSLVNNKALQAQFSFTKVPGLVASCNATVTCPATQTPSSTVSGASAIKLGVAVVFSMTAVMFV